MIMAGATWMAAGMSRPAATAGYRRSWSAMVGLIVIFLVGYALTLVFVFLDNTSWLIEVSSLIFMLGAFFVALVLSMNKRVIGVLLRHSATLEEQVALRTRELSEANRQLADSLSRLKDTQQQLVIAEKLSLVGRLAGGLAHELNNPLGFLMSNTNSLREYVAEIRHQTSLAAGAPPGNPTSPSARLEEIFEDLPALLGEMHDGLRRIQSITQAFSKMEQLQLAPPRQRLDLAGIVDSVLEKVKQERSSSFAWQWERPPEALVMSSSEELREGLYFLIQAIIELKKDPQQVARVALRVQEPSVVLAIEHDSLQLDEQERQRIFDPRVSSSSEVSGRMAFMLEPALAFHLLVRAGAAIKVEKLSPAGTVFLLSWPRA